MGYKHCFRLARLRVAAAALAATTLLIACSSSGNGKSSAGQSAGGAATPSGSTSADPSGSSGAGQRIEGTYLLISPPLITHGLPMTMTPMCASGPCDTTVEYTGSGAGAEVGSGKATWTGTQYEATIHDTLGCSIDGSVVDPAADGTVKMTIIIDPGPDGVATSIHGQWSGTYKLVGKAAGHTGCDPSFAATDFTATKQ